MSDHTEAKSLLKEIAVIHRQAWEADDMEMMGRAEETALKVCDNYNWPVNNPNLLLASLWPES